MKKLILFSLLTFLFTSCRLEVKNKNGEVIYEESISESRIEERISYIIFKRHRYVKFITGNGGSITHDPDCPYCKITK